MNDLQGKVFLVTGAGSGIGKALAKRLDSMDVKLILNDIDETALLEVAESLKQKPLCIPFSVESKNNWLLCQSTIREHFADSSYTGIDGIINNAGIAHDPTSFDTISEIDFKKVMDINFYGVLFGTQTFLPELKSKERAWVVNISSIFGVSSIGGMHAYCASKFAVRGLTESLKMEAMADFPNVTVCVVHPGGVKTPIASNAIRVGDKNSQTRNQDIKNFNKQLMTSPDKAAEIIVTGITRRKTRILIGPDARLMDWLVRLLPVNYTKILLNKLQKRGL